MKNDLSTTNQRGNSAALIDWNDPDMQAQIKETYGKNLSAQEWNLFLGLGRATGLNPFLKEIWPVKYGNAAASIFIGRDGYRRSAQTHPEYEYHSKAAVYSKDEFEIDPNEGKVKHKINLKDRGELVGAYCIVKRKSSSRPVVNYVEMKEYNKKQSVWVEKPATMIEKVAEAQGLRGNFQELFAGTYEESEGPVKGQIIDVPNITADELIGKLETAKNEEEYNVITQEVQKEMGNLSDTDKDRVIARGKELRSSFKSKEAPVSAPVVEAEQATQEAIAV